MLKLRGVLNDVSTQIARWVIAGWTFAHISRDHRHPQHFVVPLLLYPVSSSVRQNVVLQSHRQSTPVISSHRSGTGQQRTDP